MRRLGKQSSSLLFSLCASCSLENSIDVCERSRPTETAISADAKSIPGLDGDNPLVALPDGQSLLVYTATPEGESESGTNASIAGIVVDADGQPHSTCDFDTTTVESYRDGSGRRLEPTLAAPTGDSPGLLVWVEAETDSTEATRIWALPLDDRGCSRLQPFAISTPDRIARKPTVVRLGPAQFAVAWLDQLRLDSPLRLAARVIQLYRTRYEFLRTALSSEDGEPAALFPNGNMAVAVTLKPLPGNRLAVLWAENSLVEITIKFAVLDERLNTIVAPLALDRYGATDLLKLLGVNVNLSTSATHLLALWSRLQAQDRRRIAGRLLDLTAPSFASEAWTPAFALRSLSTQGEDWGMTSLALETERFLVTWVCASCPEENAAPGVAMHGVVISRNGTREFSNWECDSTDFAVSRSSLTKQSTPAAALTTSGRVTATWSGALRAHAEPSAAQDILSVQFAVQDVVPLP